METEMFCLSLSVECRSSKALWMYVSHVYLSFCKLTSLSIWILFLLLALWIQIKEENVCVFSGSRTSRRLSRSPVGSGWRDGHSGLHREHGSGKSVSVLQRHRYSRPDPDLLLSCFLRCFIVLLACLSVRQCEQPLQCEIAHLMGSDPVRYDLSGWFGQVQNNPSVLNASSLLQNSSV